MATFPARDVMASLTRKGFTLRETHHKMFHFLYLGKDIGVSTKISQGQKEIGNSLIKHMRVQMGLRTNAEFALFVERPMSQADYEDILRQQGIIVDPDP